MCAYEALEDCDAFQGPEIFALKPSEVAWLSSTMAKSGCLARLVGMLNIFVGL